MWAALKSPLLMGNDLRTLNAKALTILNNPAVIAVSQDPVGRAVHRVIRDLDVKKDEYGMGEAQVWSGHLYGGDAVVILFNAADEDLNMEASLEEIFVSDGPHGSAEQVHEKWDVYDLWANRMEEATAAKILAASSTEYEQILKDIDWYNSTAMPYKEGLKAEDPRLMGKKIGSVSAEGSLKAKVKRHSCEMYRLRTTKKNIRKYSSTKEEL